MLLVAHLWYGNVVSSYLLGGINWIIKIFLRRDVIVIQSER